MRATKTFLLMALFEGLLAASLSHAAGKPDVLGVTLGLSPSEVTAKMAKEGQLTGSRTGTIAYGRFYKEVPGSDYTARQSFTIDNRGFTRTDIKDTLEVLYSPEHARERVVTIAREQFFHEGARPAVEDRIRDYVAKYGEPSLRGGRHASEAVLVWSFDANGAVRRVRNEVLRYCNFSIERTPIINVGRGDREVGSYLDLCGSSILKVTFDRDIRQPALARHAYTWLVDYGAIYAAQDRVNGVIRDLQAKDAAEEQQKIQAGKPKL